MNSNFLCRAGWFSWILLAIYVLPTELPQTRLFAYDIRGAKGDFPLRGSFFLGLNQKRYSPSESVYVQCAVQSFGNRLDPLRLYPNMQDLVDFFVTDQNGIPIARKKKLITQNSLRNQENPNQAPRNQLQMIEISAGDTYVKQVDVKELYHFSPGQEYIVRGILYPYGFSKEKVYSKNVVRFSIEESPSTITQENFDASLFQNAQPDADEIVELFLLAEKSLYRPGGNSISKKARVLKYLDLPRYIQSYPQYHARYQQKSETGKLEILEEFAIFLTSKTEPILKEFSVLKKRNVPLHAAELEEFDKIAKKTLVTIEAIVLTGKNQTRRLQYAYTLHKRRQYYQYQYPHSTPPLMNVGNFEWRDGDYQWKIVGVSVNIPAQNRR